MLREKLNVGVIEGDISSTVDADTVAVEGIPVVQISTGGSCPLDANIIGTALSSLPADDLTLMMVTNEQRRVTTLTSGFYPGMNSAAILAAASSSIAGMAWE